MNADPLQVILAGGWVMIALALNSLLLYKTIIGLLLFVRRVRFDEVHESELKRLAEAPPVSPRAHKRALAYLQIEVVNEALKRFQQVMGARLRYSKAMTVAAPLLGLLGTVEGMLVTFRGLALEQRHEITRTMAEGISRALVTAETGLVVAIPALFILNWIKRESQRHELHLLAVKVQLMAQTRA